MTSRSRVLSFVAAGTLVLATTLGCGFISSAKKLASHAVELGKLSEKITNAQKLTYTAKYKDSDGNTDTIAQAPPKVAYLNPTTDYIFDGSTIYNCDQDDSKQLTCSKTASGDANDPDAQAADGLGGSYFTGAFGITLLTAALVVPQSDVKDSNQKIGGLDSTCVSVSGLSGVTGTSSSSDDSTDIEAFSMCVADNGVVTNFVGTDSKGKKAGITLTSFSSSVDPSVFAPPAGAKISEGTAPTIGDSGPASAPASSTGTESMAPGAESGSPSPAAS